MPRDQRRNKKISDYINSLEQHHSSLEFRGILDDIIHHSPVYDQDKLEAAYLLRKKYFNQERPSNAQIRQHIDRYIQILEEYIRFYQLQNKIKQKFPSLPIDNISFITISPKFKDKIAQYVKTLPSSNQQDLKKYMDLLTKFTSYDDANYSIASRIFIESLLRQHNNEKLNYSLDSLLTMLRRERELMQNKKKQYQRQYRHLPNKFVNIDQELGSTASDKISLDVYHQYKKELQNNPHKQVLKDALHCLNKKASYLEWLTTDHDDLRARSVDLIDRAYKYVNTANNPTLDGFIQSLNNNITIKPSQKQCLQKIITAS